MIYGIKMEICAGSPEDVRIASSFPATDRIELNSHLEEDGLTPSAEILKQAKEITTLPVLCMVRPHNDGFIYTDAEKEQMKQEAEELLKNGADGIVCGALQENRTVDEAFIHEMIRITHACKAVFVFHRAFDEIHDKEEAVRTLSSLHCERILTSGGPGNVMNNLDTLQYLNEMYGDRIEIQPAGGIDASNIETILKKTGITRFHMSLQSSEGSGEEKIRKTIGSIKAWHSPSHQHMLHHSRLLTGEDQEMFDADTYEAAMDSSEDDHDRY